MPFRITGIPSDLAAEVRQRLGPPSMATPRTEKRRPGTDPAVSVSLFTYQPFSDPTSMPAPGPIFIHATPCERYEGSELPPDFRPLPVLFEAYGTGGELLGRERVGEQRREVVLERLFAALGADYIHIRNAEAGCFMAQVDRVVA